MKPQHCDLCNAEVTRCAGFGTWCLCGLYVIACDRCAKEHGGMTRARATAVHEQRRHETEVGR